MRRALGLVAWLRFGAPCALVFVNGRYSRAALLPLARRQRAPARPWPTLLREEPALLEPHLGGGSRIQRRTAFAALNRRCSRTGPASSIAPGRAVEAPISLVFLSQTSEAGARSRRHPRVLIARRTRQPGHASSRPTAGPGRRDVPGERRDRDPRSRTVRVLDHVRVQRESESAFHVGEPGRAAGRDSRYRSITLDLGGALARTDIDVALDGEGAECELDGLFVVDGTRPRDSHTTIDHAQPHTTSREVYQGILDGSARAASSTAGSSCARTPRRSTPIQLNKNLLLSPTALVNSTPQLQILADDVRCKHASTTGQIDAQALFYLRSRGTRGGGGAGPPDVRLRRRHRRARRAWPRCGRRSRRCSASACPAAPGGDPMSASRVGPARERAVPCRARGGVASLLELREDFPILRQKIHGQPLVYLDNAATTQKPQCVIDAERRVYEEYYANIHRGVHTLSQRCDRRLRGGARQGAALPERRPARGDRLRARDDRGHQPRGRRPTAARTSAP